MSALQLNGRAPTQVRPYPRSYSGVKTLGWPMIRVSYGNVVTMTTSFAMPILCIGSANTSSITQRAKHSIERILK